MGRTLRMKSWPKSQSSSSPMPRPMTDHPTEFELVTAIAMEYFARHRCDIVVLRWAWEGTGLHQRN